MPMDMNRRARLRCMHLLEKRDYTEKELRDKLRMGKTGYTEEQIDQALEYVKSFCYVDDNRYAEKYIECMSMRKSRNQIKMELMRKGVDRECIDQALEEAQEISEEEQIVRWMEKKHYNPEDTDPKAKQRMYAFLMRKGFCTDNIQRAMRVEDW